MTTPALPPPGPASAPPASMWEDFVDVYISPVSVFLRRRDGRFGVALLVYLLVMGALAFASMRALAPAHAADARRMMARMAERSPQMREAMLQRGEPSGERSPLLGAITAVAVYAGSVFVAGAATWLVGKLLGATASIAVAIMIVVYAQFPRIVQQVVIILQGLLMDVSRLDSTFRVATSPVRFMDPNTTSMATLIAASRLDPFLLWSTALIGVGMHVIGGVSKLEAAAVALLIWVVGSLPPMIPALLF